MRRRISKFLVVPLVLWTAIGCKSQTDPEAATATQVESESEEIDHTEEANSDAPDESAVSVLDLVAMNHKNAFEKLPLVKVTVKSDPAYKSGAKTFEGYDLETILALLPRYKDINWKEHRLRFSSRDGYATVFPIEAVRGNRGVVATKVVGLKPGQNWDTYEHGKKTDTPAPFYLVWENEEFSAKRPWPYQLTRIEVLSVAGLYGAIKPKDNDALIATGFKSFKKHCMACHSMNLRGGTMGPELNVPQNIMEYRNEAQVFAFIKNPEDFRSRSAMPAMASIGDDAIRAVIAYMKTMKTQKVCTQAEQCADIALELP